MGIVEIGLFCLALLALFLIVKCLSLSAKLVLNGILGAIGLYLYNWLVAGIGLKMIPISIINILIVGFFGIPGLIALIIWQFIAKGNM